MAGKQSSIKAAFCNTIDNSNTQSSSQSRIVYMDLPSSSRTTSSSATADPTAAAGSTGSRPDSGVTYEVVSRIFDCICPDLVERPSRQLATMIVRWLRAGLTPEVIILAIEDTMIAPRPSVRYLAAICRRLIAQRCYTAEEWQRRVDRHNQSFDYYWQNINPDWVDPNGQD